MRNRFFLIGLVVIMLLAAGCQASSKPLEQARKPDQTVDPATSEYPAEVRNWLSNMKSYQVAGVIERGGKTYLLVSGGEQRTGGHEVKIARIDETDKKLTVNVEMTQPKGPAAQVISYPNAVHVMDKTLDDDKEVVFVKLADKERIPQIVGCQPTRLFLDGSPSIKVIEMELNDDEIEVEGIARVDDGTIYYRFTNRAGQTVSQSKVAAKATAPNWGCFELDDVDRPQGATHLELYRVSPEDQSQQDVVRIPL